MKPIIPIPTGTLRPVSKGDQSFVIRLLRSPEVRRYLCDDREISTSDVELLIDNSIRMESRGLGFWIIETADGGCAGICGLSAVSQQSSMPAYAFGEIEPTIALHRRYWGLGLARRALDAMIEYARNSLALSRLVAAVDRPNRRSHALILASGFRRVVIAPGPAQELVIYALVFNGSEGT